MRQLVVAVFAGLLLPSAALADKWDLDTIQMERSRFPGALELMTGKFLRHTPTFYQWCVEDRLKRLKADPNNVGLLDDLAIAYDRIGQHDKAIETALRIEKFHPGRYETAAYLGTFYFHAGQLDKGLPHIDRAMTINPGANAGREKYQKLVVEYVIRQRKGGPPKLPLADVTVHPELLPGSPTIHAVSVKANFVDFLRSKQPNNEALSEGDLATATKGVLNLMKFDRHDSAVLLEALGHLLVQPDSNPLVDAKLLAARAFLKASYLAPPGPARDAYRGMAVQALRMQTLDRQEQQISLKKVEIDFQIELTEGQGWYAQLQGNEASWIRDGRNPEAEYDRFYTKDPEVADVDMLSPVWKKKGRRRREVS